MDHRICLFVAIHLLVAATPVIAEEPARDLGAMRVAADAPVYVRTAAGPEIQGRFVRASAQALVIIGPGGRELTLPSQEVMLVWRRGDRLRNGAIIGGLVGLVAGIFGQSQCTDCSGEIALGVGLGVPIWAGLGALVDREHVGRTLIYRSP